MPNDAPTIMVGNYCHFVSVYWSDGFSNSLYHNVQQRTSLGKCPSCQFMFWFDDIDFVGTIPLEPMRIGRLERWWLNSIMDKRGILSIERKWNETPQEWKDAKRAEKPTVSYLLAYLDNPTNLTPRRELPIRRKIWWAANNYLRDNNDGTPSTNIKVLNEDEFKENLEAMLRLHAELSLLDLEEPDLKDKVLVERDLEEQAEILRELGRFEESIKLLESIKVSDEEEDESQLLKISKLVGYARNHDAQVREIERKEFRL